MIDLEQAVMVGAGVILIAEVAFVLYCSHLFERKWLLRIGVLAGFAYAMYDAWQRW